MWQTRLCGKKWPFRGRREQIWNGWIKQNKLEKRESKGKLSHLRRKSSVKQKKSVCKFYFFCRRQHSHVSNYRTAHSHSDKRKVCKSVPYYRTHARAVYSEPAKQTSNQITYIVYECWNTCTNCVMDERVILAIGAILFSFSFSFSVRYDPMLVKLLAQNINKRYA